MLPGQHPYRRVPFSALCGFVHCFQHISIRVGSFQRFPLLFGGSQGSVNLLQLLVISLLAFESLTQKQLIWMILGYKVCKAWGSSLQQKYLLREPVERFKTFTFHCMQSFFPQLLKLHGFQKLFYFVTRQQRVRWTCGS